MMLIIHFLVCFLSQAQLKVLLGEKKVEDYIPYSDDDSETNDNQQTEQGVEELSDKEGDYKSNGTLEKTQKNIPG